MLNQEDNVKSILWRALPVGAVFFIASCSPVVLLYSISIPEVKAHPATALVVVVRPMPRATTAYNAEKLSTIFVDGVFGAVTANNTVVQFPVDTGVHYIMARIDNVATVRLNFLPGRVYYLEQKNSSVRVTAPTPGAGAPSGGLTRVQTTLFAIGPDEYAAIMKTGGIRFAKFAQSKPLKSMDPMAKKAHVAAYEFWAKAKPELARMQEDYSGY
jgi:hypothetical protein